MYIHTYCIHIYIYIYIHIYIYIYTHMCSGPLHVLVAVPVLDQQVRPVGASIITRITSVIILSILFVVIIIIIIITIVIVIIITIVIAGPACRGGGSGPMRDPEYR